MRCEFWVQDRDLSAQICCVSVHMQECNKGNSGRTERKRHRKHNTVIQDTNTGQ